MKVKIIATVALLILSASWLGENLFAELAKSDVEEIRTMMKEEIRYADKRMDDLRDTLMSYKIYFYIFGKNIRVSCFEFPV